MKVTYRLPSKAIQYGYAEVEIEVSDQTPASRIGEDYSNFVYHFLKGEQAGLEAALSSHKDPTDRAVETISESFPTTVIDSTEHVHKFQYGDDGNGHSGSFCECGQEEVSDAPKKPWEQKVAPKAKPWETKQAPKAAPKVADIEW